VGFLSGWAILLDYLLLPALLSILGASAMAAVLPDVPGWIWIIVFVGLVAAINLRGIVLTARMNMIFLVIQLAAFAVFVGGALLAIAQGRASFQLSPPISGGCILLAVGVRSDPPCGPRIHRVRRNFDAQ
jgi:Gamma-aminobutyrate permease and related permeases